MVPKMDRRKRAVARGIAWVAPVILGLALASACQELGGSIGDDCLKDQDCQSGVCSELHCAAQAPLLDAAYVPPGDATLDAPLESGAEGGADAPATMPEGSTSSSDDGTAPDGQGEPPDTGSGEAGDAGPDVVDEGHPDAPTDGPTDAIADASDDRG
ncbi:MAG TPA: hypothetical protein VHV30_14230 [Polyangiaceae bacterium]|jgi:hypothetical protein|nr:hypothetical protein [Polyangiaceae bacterium]